MRDAAAKEVVEEGKNVRRGETHAQTLSGKKCAGDDAGGGSLGKWRITRVIK